MEPTINVVETLRANDYYLMTNEDGKEVYDDDGNLLFYHESGNLLALPNTEDVRRLYDLPLNTPDVKDTIKRDDVCRPGSLVPLLNEESNQVVWVGQKNERSVQATKLLIELFDSERYQTLMNNPHTVKLKIWEKIATELQAKGFKIASNIRDAGLRTFQKWRNMERTYWKFLKTNPDEFGEDKSIFRKKKPYFFDDLHAVLSKRPKEPIGESLDGEMGNYKQEEDEEDDDEDGRADRELKKRKTISDLYGTDCEAFPREALCLLTTLISSPKYNKFLKDDANKVYPIKIKVWESIYMDMIKEGWKFGSSIREGALIIAEKWRMVEKTILKKKLVGPRTLYTPTLRKAVLEELELRKALGHSHPEDPPSLPEFPNSSNRRLKGGEFEPEVIEVLLNAVGSDQYHNLMGRNSGKRLKMWEKIYEEIVFRGYDVAGTTKKEKVSRLFQKWRNMKKAFVKYQIAKFKGKEAKKPLFYELLFKIISKQILSMPNSKGDSDEEEWDEESDSECPTDFLEINHMDHDYGETSVETDINLLQQPSNVGLETNSTKEVAKHSADSSPQSKPSTSRTSRSHEVLKQIKSLHEASLAMQQQNFTKIICLLEDQISQQNRLTAVISEYIMSQTLRSKPKNGNGKRNNVMNDELPHS